MDKSVALKIALQIALMTFQRNTANAGPSWDFNLDHTVTGRRDSFDLPGAFNTFGTEQSYIRVINSSSYVGFIDFFNQEFNSSKNYT